jgi:ABC-type transporter Mla subunit MlaD
MSRTPKLGKSLTVLVAGGALIALLLHRAQPQHRLMLTACFDDVRGLKPKSKVRVAGVEVGVVSAVLARPTKKHVRAKSISQC